MTPFSPEWCQNGCDSPSPNGHDGHIPDRLGRGPSRATSVWSLDRGVPLLAHKLPGAESCHPGTDSLSPLTQGCHVIVMTDNMLVVSHINRQGGSRSRTLNRHARRLLLCAQDKFLSLRAVHVPGVLNLAADFVKTESQVGGVDVEPSNSSPDLGFVPQSGSGSLCIARVVPMPTLVLPDFPGTPGYRCFRSPLARHEAVHVSARQADSSSSVPGEGKRCPFPTRSSVLVSPDLYSGRMVLSTHFYQVLELRSWHGSRFPGFICLNQPCNRFVIGPERAVFLAWRVWYISKHLSLRSVVWTYERERLRLLA